jgi:adenylate cyclase
VIDLFHVGFNVEEELGLNWLFQIRGVRPPPEEVVVVSTDRQSAYELGLPQEPYKWPRSLHGRLVSRLAEQGAKVIAFDLFFKDIGSQPSRRRCLAKSQFRTLTNRWKITDCCRHLSGPIARKTVSL